MTMLGHRYPLKYTPYWICGNSSKEKFNVLESCAEPCQPSPLTPDKFLSECRYPLIRFCEIPPSIHFTDQEYSFYADYHEYPYVHSLCVTFETHNIPRTSQYISTKVNALHTEYLSKKKKLANYDCNLKNNLLSHLFIIKEYISKYNTKWKELMTVRRLALPHSIIKHVLSPYVYELDAYQTIQYLDDNTRINQTEWFQYAFYFIEFTSYQWQKFFYEHILSDGRYNEAIRSMMDQYNRLAYRRFKYWKLTPFSIRLYSKKNTAQNVIPLICHSIKSDDNELFEFCLKLFDSHSIPPKHFWGILIFQAFKLIHGEEQLDTFRKLCTQMKQHCNGKQDIMDASFKKFNEKACKSQQVDYNNEVKFEMLNAMKNIIGYDVNDMVPYCCANDDFCLIQEFIEEDFRKCTCT
eukprot:75327_1